MTSEGCNLQRFVVCLGLDGELMQPCSAEWFAHSDINHMEPCQFRAMFEVNGVRVGMQGGGGGGQYTRIIMNNPNDGT